jgi:hypothetical protein
VSQKKYTKKRKIWKEQLFKLKNLTQFRDVGVILRFGGNSAKSRQRGIPKCCMTNLYEYGPSWLTDGLLPLWTSLGFVKLNIKYCMYTCDDGDFQFLKVSEPSFSSTFYKNIAKQKVGEMWSRSLRNSDDHPSPLAISKYNQVKIDCNCICN